MVKSVALIGHGAIAKDLIKRITADPFLRVAQVVVRSATHTAQSNLGCQIEAIDKIEDLSDDVDFVLECAGHEALRAHGAAVLARGIDLAILSVGALSDDALKDALEQSARQAGVQTVIVPGAIGGIDAIAAAGQDAIQQLTYTGSKAPMSWLGTPAEAAFDLAGLQTRVEIFSGSAREAAQKFPKNANVVATVALAGLGFDATKVRLFADPKATRNTHRIQAQGPNFDFDYTTSGGTLADNPKTSALTSLSAYRVLRSQAYPIIL